ncbi:MAG: tetratricopeptide repeat protein [Thermoanaerobaculia bacterium]
MSRTHRTIALVCALALSIPLAAPAETPAQQRIRAARERMERAPSASERAAALIALASAHTARARESGEGAHYDRALEALRRAREAGAAGGELTKIAAWVRLGRHEFRAAEALARQSVGQAPGDHESWGLLGDALMELGRSDEAADAYQRMMDLRPGPGAYLRASYYRERVGDLEAAAELLERALAATGARESEQVAWILVHRASLEDRLGHSARAEALLRQALSRFPGYHYALTALAEHHLEHGRPDEALPWARRALDAAPHAERWLILADALRATGREDEAREAEDRFERTALANVDQPDNENLFLVDYYLDRRPNPSRALAIARREAARRPDPPTLERLARAERRHRGEADDRDPGGPAGQLRHAAPEMTLRRGKPPGSPQIRAAPGGSMGA